MEVTRIVSSSFIVAMPTTKDVAAPLSLFDHPSSASGVSWEPVIGDDPYARHRRAILLEPDGSPWVHGNLFLLHLLKIKSHQASTDVQKAAALQMVRNVLTELKIDYLSDQKFKSKRPTYAIKEYFIKQTKSGMKVKYANRIIGVMVEFYEWLKDYTNHKFKWPLFIKKKYMSHHTDEAGYQFSVEKITTDLYIKETDTGEIDKQYIQDGGKLRPLNTHEQKELINALMGIGNIEMTLAFLIALKTGARMLTVFTLKTDILRDHDVEDTDELPVLIGKESNISNKNNKRMVIYIPGWIHNRLRTYISSPRAARRKILNHMNNASDQFIFLTRQGNPYYIGQKDADFLKYPDPPSGRSVRKFISSQLHPQLEKKGSKLRMSFHDLRATFGMNYARAAVNELELGRISKSGLLNELKQRMGHASIKTTMLYLDYDFAEKYDFKIQEEWETSLMTDGDFMKD